MYFVKNLAKYDQKTALIDDAGNTITYRALADRVDDFCKKLGSERRLISIDLASEIEPVIAYLAALKGGHPVLIQDQGSSAKDQKIHDLFKPDLAYRKNANGQWQLYAEQEKSSQQLHQDLCILLSTSGSTGSPKLVRLSRSNIEANTKSIVSYLEINGEHTVIANLPLYHSFGLSILNTHLSAGTTIALSNLSVSSREFWSRFETLKPRCLYGVPYSFELLDRIGFRQQKHELDFIAQAGGALPSETATRYARWASDNTCKLYLMYGQTEASPRISYVPPDKVLEFPDCIGQAIPGGELSLIDSDSQVIKEMNTAGELRYIGPNIMMGYAEKAADLALGSTLQELHTGDISERVSEGMFRIVGRKSRFVKIYGQRIALDEIERFLSEKQMPAAVTGDDEEIVLYCEERSRQKALLDLMVDQYKLPATVFRIVHIDQIPRTDSGKIRYAALDSIIDEAKEPSQSYRSLHEAYTDILMLSDIKPSDSFLSLGGTSLSFVLASIAVEDHVGYLPHNWEAISIADLENLSANNAEDQTPAEKWPVWSTVALAIFFLIALEAVEQIRSYLNPFYDVEAPLIWHEDGQYYSYVPNTEERLQNNIVFEVNSLGLRSPELPQKPAPDELRLAILGASSIAGYYTETNAETIPALIENNLRQALGGSREINVINGGIHGHILEQTQAILQSVIMPQEPSAFVLYPSMNDIALLCLPDKPAPETNAGLPTIEAPGWLRFYDLVNKNTAFLRPDVTVEQAVAPKTLDIAGYKERLRTILQTILKSGNSLILTTNARSFFALSSDTSSKEQLTPIFARLHQCLEMPEILYLSNALNDQVRMLSRELNIPLIDLAERMKPHPEFFVDESHFNDDGNRFIADLITQSLLENLAGQK